MCGQLELRPASADNKIKNGQIFDFPMRLQLKSIFHEGLNHELQLRLRPPWTGIAFWFRLDIESIDVDPGRRSHNLVIPWALRWSKRELQQRSQRSVNRYEPATGKTYGRWEQSGPVHFHRRHFERRFLRRRL